MQRLALPLVAAATAFAASCAGNRSGIGDAGGSDAGNGLPDAGDAGTSGDAGPACPSCIGFVNGVIFDGTNVGGGYVVIDGGTILTVAIGSAAIPSVGTLVDLTGKLLLPGLIDAHTHLFAAAGPRGWAPPVSLIDDHLKAFLRAGVTSILDLGSPAEEIFTYRSRIAAGALRGPNLFAAGPFLTPTGGHPCYSGQPPGDTCSFVDQLGDVSTVMGFLLPLEPDVIKLVLEPGFGVALPELSDPDIGAIQMAAADAGLIAIAHVFQSADVLTMLGLGIHALAHVPGYDAMTPAMAAAVADAGAVVIPTISFGAGYVAMSTQTGPWTLNGGDGGGDGGAGDDVATVVLQALANKTLLGVQTSLPARQTYAGWLANEQHNFALELDAGVSFVAGTDCGNPADFHGLALAAELAQYVALGMSPLAALHSATAATADWLGHPELGHLAPGARADLLVVDGDATNDIRDLTQVDQVYKDGVLLDRAALSVATGGSLVRTTVTGLAAGSLCLEISECAAGLTCALGAQRCQPICGDGGSCAFGSVCDADPNGGPDFCYAGAACTLIPQNCPNAAACDFEGNGATDCVDATGAMATLSCAEAGGCARGYQCDPSSGTCAELCTLDGGACGAESCVSQASVAELQIGLCE